MRILISILALTSAFFVSAEPVIDDETSPYYGYEYVSANEKQGTLYVDSSYGTTWPSPKAGFDNYFNYEAYAADFFQVNTLIERVDVSGRFHTYYIKFETFSDCSGSPCNRNEKAFTRQFTTTDGTVYSCPDTYPVGPIEISGSQLCLREAKPKDCPAGHHSRAVSKALGSTECVPKECPPAGTGESLASTPMTGGVPFSGGGMYCNDGCAYSVNAEQISSDKYAVGTSQGAACGDKPYDNKKLADEGDTGECSVSTGDVPLLSCPNANPTTPEKDPHNNDDSKTPEDETPEKPKENCAEGDSACNLKNVETEIENSANKQIDNDNKLHNKQIDAATKNTNALLNILESIDTSILLQTQQDDRLHAVTVSKFNELVDAVNGIETGGGGGGNGNGDGSGGDCDGSPSECVPIEGAEIPIENINLGQYADKYDDWLPNAELPEQSCITLTDGTNLCLSYTAIIKLFQAFSALLVISALIHSAKIVAGAF